MSVRLLVTATVLLIFSSCSQAPKPAAAIGEAFAGPQTLQLRQDLGAKAAVTATVGHGERLDIIAVRRRFVKVHTARGVEGWTDARRLLTPQQMKELARLKSQSAKVPSQGQATVFDTLNIHTEPNRSAPSFLQVKEGDMIDVIGHRLAARIPYDSPLVKPAPPKAAPVRRRPRGKGREDETVAPPSPPQPPALPENWLELSRTPAEANRAGQPRREEPPQVPVDDWSLVRTRDGKAGWVLTRALQMKIPDEVAQYAEGNRITSYFSLGKIRDGTETKDNWLWTTIEGGRKTHQFDSFRVFVYSLRRHRYETAYIERNLTGYFPVEAHPVEIRRPKGSVSAQGFSLIVREKDGSLTRRTYAFEGYRVTLVRKTPWSLPAEEEADDVAAEPAPRPADEGWLDKARKKLEDWRGKPKR